MQKQISQNLLNYGEIKSWRKSEDEKESPVGGNRIKRKESCCENWNATDTC
jgi:hypothetical protein